MTARYLAIPLLVCSALTAHATQVDADTLMVLDEVSVTAIKQPGALSIQPLAVTTLRTTELQRFDINGLKGVSTIAPNFFMSDHGSRMTGAIYVRGLGARIDQSAVGLSIDNVPCVNKDAFDFDITDISKIEVMRGPQSTLYGRNTLAGQINIQTLSPLSFQGLRFMAQCGSGTSFKAAASAYTLLRPTVGMALSASAYYTGGFYTNRYNGQSADSDKGFSARWKTSARLSPNVMLENTAALTWSRQGGYPYAYSVTGEINYNDPCSYRRLSFTDGLTLTWITGHFTAASITSMQYIDDRMTMDQDFLPDSYFTLTQARKEWAMTQDFVIRGSAGKYSWLAGATVMTKRASISAPVTFKATGIDSLIIYHRNKANPSYPIEWDTDQFLLGSHFVTPVTSLAAYHRSSLKLHNVNLTASARLEYEKTALAYRSYCDTGFKTLDPDGSLFRHDNIEIDQTRRLFQTFVEFLPQITATWHISKSYLYASVAEGFKTGGFNTQMFSDVLQQQVREYLGLTQMYQTEKIVSYKPEYSTNYEIGTHVDCHGSKVDADVALFWIDCRNQQLTTYPGGITTGRIMTNAGRSRSIGAELSVNYRPSVRWIWNLAYGYTNAKFRTYNDGIHDYAGKYVPYAPQHTLFVAASYLLKVNNNTLSGISFQPSVKCVGPIYWDEANTLRQPFYGQLAAQITLHGKKYWTLTAWGENLTDTQFDVFRYVSIGNTFFQRGRPLRGGITLRINLANDI